METKIFNCIICASKMVGNKATTTIRTVVCDSWDAAQAETAMMELAKEIYKDKISKKYKIHVFVQELDKEKLRRLIDGESLTITDAEPKFIM
jgi:transcription elongation factor Elf1